MAWIAQRYVSGLSLLQPRLDLWGTGGRLKTRWGSPYMVDGFPCVLWVPLSHVHETPTSVSYRTSVAELSVQSK